MIRRLLRWLRLWPGPTKSIGELTNADIDSWPVLPDGVEGVWMFHLPAGQICTPMDECFVCEEKMPDPESGELCWGVPGKGVAHGDCYEPEDEEGEAA